MTMIIFLNGASSSGKTTLGRALQRLIDRPTFYFSSDQLVEANILPEVDRQAQTGERAWRVGGAVSGHPSPHPPVYLDP